VIVLKPAHRHRRSAGQIGAHSGHQLVSLNFNFF